jgi:uncharacterized membrane protein
MPILMRDGLAERRLQRAKMLGTLVVLLWFFVGGLAHFVFLDAEIRIVPPYIPWPRAAVLISGAFELLGAVGLLRKSTRPAAGIGLFILTICVTPVHIHMLQHPDLFSVPYWALVARLPLQFALLVLIGWSTFWKTSRSFEEGR